MSLVLTRMFSALLAVSQELIDALGDKFKWVIDIVNAIDVILLPLLVVVGAAGTIYAVVIGVNMARADSTEQREEAKKKLINVLVGLVVAIALILFFKYVFLNSILPSFFVSK